MRVTELAGTLAGYILGLFTGAISFIRQSRTFHPRGYLFEAEVSSETFPPHAIVRFSAALWKEREWIDVLGISVRFMKERPRSFHPGPTDQDLLFATIKYPWQTPFAPLLTWYKDYFKNKYYAVSPFSNEKNDLVKYRLVPKNSVIGKGSREEKLLSAILIGNTFFELQIKKMGSSEEKWMPLARLKILRPLNYDQEALRFNPFNNGMHINPVGFVHHLRIGAYKLSQVARPKAMKERSRERISALD